MSQRIVCCRGKRPHTCCPDVLSVSSKGNSQEEIPRREELGFSLHRCCGLVISCVQLFCDPMDCSLPGSSVHGILQARILEWVAMPFPRGLPNPGIKPVSPVALALQVDSLLLPLLSKGFTTRKPFDNIGKFFYLNI